MPNHTPDRPRSSAAPQGRRSQSAVRGGEAGPDLAAWLRARVLSFAEEWAAEIRVRGLGQATALDDIVARQVLQLSIMIPELFDRHATQVLDLWTRACELFGTVAAKRGLAAGEVIEEFQILRSLVIRELYKDPLVGGAPTLREALRLNGVVDRGVTHASVGHTDAMFFQLLEDADAPIGLASEQIAREAEKQLSLISEELETIVGPDALVRESVAQEWTSSGGAKDA